jgi:periplasmic protein TonB
MFEESLVASRVGTVSAEKRWTVAASIGLQVAVAGVVMVLPLLHPEMLPFHVAAPKVLMPLMPRPPVPVRVETASSEASSSTYAPVVTRALLFNSSPNQLPTAGDPPPLLPVGSGMGGPNGLPAGIGIGDSNGPAVSVRPEPKPAGRLRISSGVSEGMLLAPIRPMYPTIAKAAGVQGTVVVEAIISRTGTIESLHVVSGPMMLQNAALEAIREARYRPYLLNGEPTEVQTTITVNFRMGG